MPSVPNLPPPLHRVRPLLTQEVTLVWFLIQPFTPLTQHILLSHKVFKGMGHCAENECHFLLFVFFPKTWLQSMCLNQGSNFVGRNFSCPFRRHPFVRPVHVRYHWHRCVAATLWKLSYPDQPKGGSPTGQVWGGRWGRQGQSERSGREAVLLYEVQLYHRSGRRAF